MTTSHLPRRRPTGFTLMELLVVIAIILVLSAILVPTVITLKDRANKGKAAQIIRDLCALSMSYANDNNDELPREDAKGADTWQAMQDPENFKAWFNSLPKMAGRRNVAELSETPRAFYTKENMLFIPGAPYPADDEKMRRPLFAVAMNNKLMRTDQDGKKPAVKRVQITHPSRTPLFLEQGLPGEKRAEMQLGKDFDGQPKASARSFPPRYGGKAVIGFVDGHVEEWAPKDLLTVTNNFPWPPEDIIWMRNPEENPNE
jgi:prepilin-type N-terminal cleavage/methylation domain-containing protein/prepilin-type processing-associated H-X9-DG protein